MSEYRIRADSSATRADEELAAEFARLTLRQIAEMRSELNEWAETGIAIALEWLGDE